MERQANVRLAASSQGPGQLPVGPRRTGHPPQCHPLSLTRRSPETLQNPCSRRSPVQGRSARREIHLRPRTRTIPATWKRTAVQPPRMLTDMTGITASITRSAGDGRRTHATTRQMMMEVMTRTSRLVEEEPAKEMEGDLHIRHPEEKETSLVLHPDRRVSLMVMYRVTRSLKCFLR